MLLAFSMAKREKPAKPLIRRFCEPHNWSEQFGEEKYLLFMSGIETSYIRCPR